MTQLLSELVSIVTSASLLMAGCSPSHDAPRRTRAPFGSVDGKEVFLYTLRNNAGMEAHITNYGGIVVSLLVPDKSNTPGDVVLGYDSLSSYLKATPYFGAIVGRYGNRIGKAKFTLDGKEYILNANDGPNTLHGGLRGFDKVVWDADGTTPATQPSLSLSYLSKDGEEGYPGSLKATVVYTLTDSNELRIDYTASTDRPTVLNLTHHSYFNLAGPGNGDILSHELMLNADKFTPIDSGLITTGDLKPVE